MALIWAVVIGWVVYIGIALGCVGLIWWLFASEKKDGGNFGD